MCGIAGFMTFDGSIPSKEIIEKMQKNLFHRGPDDSGDYFADGIALAHQRLSIIGLKNGNQPIISNKNNVLIANAEIYNYKELYKIFKNFLFKSSSDCEVILSSYEQYGSSFCKILEGMYALALYDENEKTLYLSRDPFGIKPLYYSETEFGLIFSSEIKSLISSGLIDVKQDEIAMQSFMQLQFSPGSQTIFKSIKRVSPGETLIIKRGRIVKREYIESFPVNRKLINNEEVALEKLDIAMRKSISLHERSDVPIGLFFSGGIDSTCLLSLMHHDADRKIKTFTASFKGYNDFEIDKVNLISNHFGTEQITVDVTKEVFFERLPEIVMSMDDPIADYAIIPTYLLAEKAASEVKVILSGEGGDELLAGYGRYRRMLRPKIFGGREMYDKGNFDGLNILKKSFNSWKFLLSDFKDKSCKEDRTKLQIAQLIDCKFWLPDDLLIKTDRCLMAHGVEGRVPFLNIELARLLFNFSDNLKIQKKLGKYILRKWLGNSYPFYNFHEKKSGFTVPVSDWIFSEGNKLGQLVAKQEVIKEIMDYKSVEALFTSKGKRQSFAAWVLLFYTIWYKYFFQNKTIDGSVFDVLSD